MNPPGMEAALETENGPVAQHQSQTEQTGAPGRTSPGRMQELQLGMDGGQGRGRGPPVGDTPSCQRPPQSPRPGKLGPFLAARDVLSL